LHGRQLHRLLELSLLQELLLHDGLLDEGGVGECLTLHGISNDLGLLVRLLPDRSLELSGKVGLEGRLILREE